MSFLLTLSIPAPFSLLQRRPAGQFPSHPSIILFLSSPTMNHQSHTPTTTHIHPSIISAQLTTNTSIHHRRPACTHEARGRRRRGGRAGAGGAAVLLPLPLPPLLAHMANRPHCSCSAHLPASICDVMFLSTQACFKAHLTHASPSTTAWSQHKCHSLLMA